MFTETRTEYFDRPQLRVVPPSDPTPTSRLTPGWRAVFFGVVFFLTTGVAMWAVSLPTFGAFAMGMGWMLVLGQISEWERTIDPEPADVDDPMARVDDHLAELDQAARRFEDDRRVRLAAYVDTHNVRDLAALPCRYGCQDPLTCRWPHVGCKHCADARQVAASGR